MQTGNSELLQNALTTPNYRTDLARYYTFRYIIQQDGSKKF